MAWTFDAYRIDPSRHEVTRNGQPVAVEPQVFAVLLHLIAHRDRMVTRDELAEAVWPGIAVSEASIATRIRAARAALGDDGARQAVIRTVHGLGFRFVADLREDTTPAGPLRPLGRPTIAVLPLRVLGAPDSFDILAEAIPHEIILALSRLRWLSVTARGSSFRFRADRPDLDLVTAALGVRYVLSGVMEAEGRAVSVTVELTDAENAELIWADRITAGIDALAEMRATIVSRIIAALEWHVPEHEARQAGVRGSAAFDAWASFHLGLRHLYRFTAVDNAAAKAHFQRAAALDPGFARAEAGLSFTSFIEAFLRIVPDCDAAARAARAHAERGLELDPLDPFVNFTMGRAHWLTGEIDSARHWLSRAVAFNPNYAQGFYASGFTAMLAGDAAECDGAISAALRLSPIDPLLYGMYGVRAQILMQKGDYAQAALWAERAATAPGAHHLIAMIAVAACGLAGETAQATRWSLTARQKRRDVTAEDFSRAFPLRDATARRMIEATLRNHGF